MRGAGWPGNKASHSCFTFTRGSWVTTNTKEQFINHDCKVNISTGVPFAKFTHLRSYIAHGHDCNITGKTTWPGAPPGGVLLLGGDHGPSLSELTDNTGHAGSPTTNTGSFQLEYNMK